MESAYCAVRTESLHKTDTIRHCGPGISVSIATDYELDGPGSNPGEDEIFPPVQTSPGAHPASCKMATGLSRG